MFLIREAKYQVYISEKLPWRKLENMSQRSKLKERNQLKYYTNLPHEKRQKKKKARKEQLMKKEPRMEEWNDNSGQRDGEEEIQLQFINALEVILNSSM